MSLTSQRLVILHGANNTTLDITEHITVPSYGVNRKPVYEEWTDSNYTKHKFLVRNRAEGSFTVKYMDKEEFVNFNAFVNNNLNENGTIDATLYFNNLNSTARVSIFISYDLKNTLPYMDAKSYEGFDVTIEER